MDRDKTDNERELTSTMGNVLSVSIKDEKNDTSGSDATPTSSTDANTTTTSSQIVSDDPISSTSSDVVDLNKSKTLETMMPSSLEITQTSVDPETDLLEMSISSGPREKITEDVEDLVHDLESLLGESTDSFNIPIRRKEDRKSPIEKEKAKPIETPVVEDYILSSGPSINKVNDEAENCTLEKDIVNSATVEEVIKENKEETEPNIVTESDDKEISENVCSDGDKELPSTDLESETNVEEKCVTEDVQHDTVIENAEIIEDSKPIEEFIIEEVDGSEVITDQSVNIECEEINAEPIVEEPEDNTEPEQTSAENKEDQQDENQIVVTEVEPAETIPETCNEENLETEIEITEEISVVCAEESNVGDSKTETEHKEEEISSVEATEIEKVAESVPENSAVDSEVLSENKKDDSPEIENIVHSEPPTEVVECVEATVESVVETKTNLEEVAVPESTEFEVATTETVNEVEIEEHKTPEEVIETCETTELETVSCEVNSTDLKDIEPQETDDNLESNIPQSSEPKTDPECISSEPVECEINEVTTDDTEIQQEESNCEPNESELAETEIVTTPTVDDDSSTITQLSEAAKEAQEGEQPQTDSVIEEIVKTDVVETKISEPVTEEAEIFSVEIVESGIEEIEPISGEQIEPSEETKDLVAELDFPNDVDVKEVAESALQELTQNFKENEVELQPEAIPELDTEIQESKLVEEDLLVVNCDYAKIETTVSEEIPLKPTVEEDGVKLQLYEYSELTAEVLESTDDATGTCQDGKQVAALEDVTTEVSEPDLGWTESVLPKDDDETVENDLEDASNVPGLEISDDDDTKIIQPEAERVFFSPAADSDSEDTVPTLVLEPDEINPSPEKDIVETDEDKLPGIEEILNDQPDVEDVPENIDMQENLETILAVASLQNTDSAVTEISDKERREIEALRKAVESITEIPSSDYTIAEDVEEFQQIPEPEPIQGLVQISTSDTRVKTQETVQAEVKPTNSERDKRTTDTENTVQTFPDTSANKTEAVEPRETITILPDSSQSAAATEEAKPTEIPREKESKHSKTNERPKRHKKSSADNKLEELSIIVDTPERDKAYGPKVTIKPIKVPDEEVSTTSNSDSEIGKGSLKMTITKQSDTMHSVLKIYESDNSEPLQEQDEPIPKLIIKPKMQQVEQQHSPKMSTRSSKQMYSPTSSTQRSGSPRITIKPVIKPDKEPISPLKIKIKPEEGSKRHSPKLTIKPVTKPEEECRENVQSPRKVTIKPVVKSDDLEQAPSPRITIKPIPKPDSEKEAVTVSPRLNIKLKKQDDDDLDVDRERSSPKITIKPIIKPQELESQQGEAEDSVKERIVLKINKGNLPTPTKESKKREHPPDDEKSEKLAKITVKFSKGGGHAHIVQQPEESNKRSYEEQSNTEKYKKQKTDNESPVLTRSKHKDVSSEQSDLHVVETRSKHHPRELPETSQCELTRSRQGLTVSPRSRANNDGIDDVRIIETKLNSPIVISEDSRSQDSGSCIIVENPKDPLAGLPTYDVTMKSVMESSPVVPQQDSAGSTPVIPATPTPRKRGRPRKVPIVVREEFKEQEEPKPEPPKKEETPLLHESGRPKRSCRGQNVRATLGIKPRKPRGPGRGRGGKRGMGTRVLPSKSEEEPKLSKNKLKFIQENLKVELLRSDDDKKSIDLPQLLNEDIKPPAPLEVPSPCTFVPVPSPQELLPSPIIHPEPSPKPGNSLLTTEIADSTCVPPATPSTSRVECIEIVMVDEETRMSADTNSRAQTPAKQVAVGDSLVEESQSSMQSTGTTESSKTASTRPNKAPRLEVQEPEGAVISADQLTEYYWNGNGPFMLQEQVAQFLGIKSFKRKYPGIMRRMLEIQERDFIRESGLASEHMCDLGLTAVNSADILDIMYSDFQEKYEEYCKHQRDRQAKELINKQKALTLAASQDRNKADITEQAVQSAAQWNATFNKARKEQRKACMDLQTLTVHYPKGKMKQLNKPKVGNYPVALVPGQFTDYYKEFTPTEINNLPLNTMCYNEINVNILPAEESEDSVSEASDSESESSSSSSDSGSSSSGVEDCKLCKHTPKKGASK